MLTAFDAVFFFVQILRNYRNFLILKNANLFYSLFISKISHDFVKITQFMEYKQSQAKGCDCVSFKIYLAGGMGNLSFVEYASWRRRLKQSLKDISVERRLDITDPSRFYNFEEKNYKSQKEIMEFDLYKVRNADLVIVNFNDPNSIGTAMELMLSRELHIPIVGINADQKELHPWLTECCIRICDNWEELVEYVRDYFLIER